MDHIKCITTNLLTPIDKVWGQSYRRNENLENTQQPGFAHCHIRFGDNAALKSFLHTDIFQRYTTLIAAYTLHHQLPIEHAS